MRNVAKITIYIVGILSIVLHILTTLDMYYGAGFLFVNEYYELAFVRSEFEIITLGILSLFSFVKLVGYLFKRPLRYATRKISLAIIFLLIGIFYSGHYVVIGDYYHGTTDKTIFNDKFYLFTIRSKSVKIPENLEHIRKIDWANNYQDYLVVRRFEIPGGETFVTLCGFGPLFDLSSAQSHSQIVGKRTE